MFPPEANIKWMKYIKQWLYMYIKYIKQTIGGLVAQDNDT